MQEDELSSEDIAEKMLHKRGGTRSERYLSKLCERTFLRLWSYPGIYRDQSSGGGLKSGKEVCDLLVVFNEHVIIFSDKDCEFPDTGNLELDWSRWFRRAVLESANQLFGAERWIRNYPTRLYLDFELKHKFPIDLPDISNAKFHRILIAHNASERCKRSLGGSGSLMIAPGIIGDMHLRKISEGGSPFAVGWINPEKGFIHILDDTTLNIILGYLDTITDFISYITKKEKFIEAGYLIAAAGEEDLLAYYLYYLNKDGEHDFKFPEDMNGILIDEGFWEGFLESPQLKAKEEADRISYFWDALIEKFTYHIVTDTQQYAYPKGIREQEKLMRFFARESRTRRRMLSSSMINLISKAQDDLKLTRVMKSSHPGDPYYVFLILPHVQSITDEEYREFRRMLLWKYCIVTKHRFPDAQQVIGLATEGWKEEYSSEDAVYFDAKDWNDDYEAEAQELYEELGLLKNVTISGFKEYEFPVMSKSARRRLARKKGRRRI